MSITQIENRGEFTRRTRKMYNFSSSSKKELDSCHPYLRLICNRIITFYDIAVICGYRGKKKQNQTYEDGYSQLQYPNSKHNKKPSLAVDIAPYPIDWEDIERFCVMGGILKAVANDMGINITWGGDWGWDYGHVELNDE